MATEIIYSDIPINFNLHPVSGDLVQVTNVSAINQSIKNIVLTSKYERFWDPEQGADTYRTLFSNASADTESLLEMFIRKAIVRDETRVTGLNVSVVADVDRNSYVCTIKYIPINTLEPVSLNVILKRAR